MDLSYQKIISAIAGAGIIIFCESIYACFRLFKKRTTLFFFVCQLAICSSCLLNIFNILLYFEFSLRILPTVIISALIKFICDISYPIMVLLRLKIIYYISSIIMYIPVVLAIVLFPLRVINIYWFIIDKKDYNLIFIIFSVLTFAIVIEYIIINIFFIIVAIKRFDNIIHTKFVIIVNIIVIILGGGELLYLFISKWGWAVLCILPVIIQFEVRLEIEILSYITQSVESTREELIRGVLLSNDNQFS